MKQNIINLDCQLLSFTMLLLMGLQAQRFHKFQMKYEHLLSKYSYDMKALLLLVPFFFIIIIRVFVSTGVHVFSVLGRGAPPARCFPRCFLILSCCPSLFYKQETGNESMSDFSSILLHPLCRHALTRAHCDALVCEQSGLSLVIEVGHRGCSWLHQIAARGPHLWGHGLPRGVQGAGSGTAEPCWKGHLCGEQPRSQLERKQRIPDQRGHARVDQRNEGGSR